MNNKCINRWANRTY